MPRSVHPDFFLGLPTYPSIFAKLFNKLGLVTQRSRLRHRPKMNELNLSRVRMAMNKCRGFEQPPYYLKITCYMYRQMFGGGRVAVKIVRILPLATPPLEMRAFPCVP